MGWSKTGSDWASINFQDSSILTEPFEAWAEHTMVLPVGLNYTPSGFSTNDISQNPGLWAGLQQNIIDEIAWFKQSASLSNDPYTPGHYDGESDAPNWSFENASKAAGLWLDSSHYGFRRWVGSAPPADWTSISDPGWLWGVAQCNDMLFVPGAGAWILADLQAIINVTNWTAYGTWPGDESWTDSVVMSGSSYNNTDDATAKANAIANWASAVGPGGICEASTGGSSPGSYGASIYRSKADCHYYAFRYRDSTIELYLIPTGTESGDYDANGDWTGSPDTYNLVKTQSVSAGPGTMDVSKTIGAISPYPNWPASDPGNTGWKIAGGMALAMWDFDYCG